jgi:hypothetical protein
MQRLAWIALLLAISSCGNNTGVGDGGLLDFGPGTCTLAGTDPMCGKTCTGDSDCPDSLYCSGGKCAAQCTSASPCPSEYVCAKGRCLHIGGMNPGGCTNLQCKQLDCAPAGGVSTTLTGKVYAPNGTLPLYNALVYVPNAQVQPLQEGVTCDRCGANQSGQPIAAAITGTDGSFTLQNVPVSDNLPLVIQVGKWRRQIAIPKIAPCQVQAITDLSLQRLPKTKAEGDIPKMAIATGNADPFECLLLKIGISPQEITRPSENGRVHFYRLNGRNMSPAVPQADDAQNGLYSSLDKLKTYDVVMLPCEGGPTLGNKSDPQLKNMVDYTTAGGRVFATHYSYTWLQKLTNNEPAPPFPGVATWQLDTMPFPQGDFFGTIDTSFPKGMAFSQWLGGPEVTALVTMGANAGKLDIQDPRLDVTTIMDPPAKRWVYSDTGNQAKTVQHFTFNTPLMGAALDDMGQPIQCGRVVYSDFHVSAGAAQNGSFPNSCRNEPLSPQEKALAFMLFDLSACVQDDDIPVGPPIF